MESPLRSFVIAIITTTLATAGASAQSIFGRNLIQNPGAEAGDVSMPEYTGSVPSIPGWNRVGKTDVIPYGRFMDLSHLAPMNHLDNYFVGGWSNSSSTIPQEIDISAGAVAIDSGAVTFDVSAYLGDDFGKRDSAALTVSFQDAGGRGLKSVTLGPVTAPAGFIGMLFQRRIGAVPKLARKVTVAVEFTRFTGADNDGAADDLSLILNAPTAADSVLNRNLLVNPGAEDGPAASSGREIASDVPGWTRTTPLSVERYDPRGRFSSAMPGSPNRGAGLFTAGEDSEISVGVQDIDVSAAAAQIDSGRVRYSASAWLGGYASRGGSTNLTVEFRDWNDMVLSAVPLGPVTSADRGGEARLLARSLDGVVPAGTRQIRVELKLKMTRADGSSPNDGCADGLSLALTGSAAPAISRVRTAQGFGGFSSMSPGTWIEITGYGLAPGTREWAPADFNGALAPQSLDGVRVMIAGQSAFLNYISPGQVNALVPANVEPGNASIVVSHGGSNIGPYSMNVSATMPGLLAPESFRLNGHQHVVALFPDWRTYVLPEAVNLGVPSRPAKPGEEIILLGAGFGGVTPDVPAGTVVSQANRLTTPLEIRIGGVLAELKYAGLAPGNVGLYQFNVIVPVLADNQAAPLTFKLGAKEASQTLYLAIQR